MPYEFSWYVPRRVIYVRIHGDLTVNELTQLKEESRDFASKGDAPVHAIIDTLAMTSMPHDLPGIFRSMMQGERPLNAFSVLVTTNRIA
ncbi:MAG TPA: hypothetical protein VHL11_19745, partial [Phototrophicaceae bacterium]|nr:hypothetical protein [Phototrophicaceae bacterium]